MFHRIVCPNDQSELVFWKKTDTHHVFKCPVCDYVHQGAVRHDLPKRFEQLKFDLESETAVHRNLLSEYEKLLAVNKRLAAERDELRDARIRCKCGKYLHYTKHRDNIKEVEIHHCPLTKLFQDCNYKGTFANCSPSNCENCIKEDSKNG